MSSSNTSTSRIFSFGLLIIIFLFFILPLNLDIIYTGPYLLKGNAGANDVLLAFSIFNNLLFLVALACLGKGILTYIHETESRKEPLHLLSVFMAGSFILLSLFLSGNFAQEYPWMNPGGLTAPLIFLGVAIITISLVFFCSGLIFKVFNAIAGLINLKPSSIFVGLALLSLVPNIALLFLQHSPSIRRDVVEREFNFSFCQVDADCSSNITNPKTCGFFGYPSTDAPLPRYISSLGKVCIKSDNLNKIPQAQFKDLVDGLSIYLDISPKFFSDPESLLWTVAVKAQDPKRLIKIEVTIKSPLGDTQTYEVPLSLNLPIPPSHLLYSNNYIRINSDRIIISNGEHLLTMHPYNFSRDQKKIKEWFPVFGEYEITWVLNGVSSNPQKINYAGSL